MAVLELSRFVFTEVNWVLQRQPKGIDFFSNCEREKEEINCYGCSSVLEVMDSTWNRFFILAVTNHSQHAAAISSIHLFCKKVRTEADCKNGTCRDEGVVPKSDYKVRQFSNECNN